MVAIDDVGDMGTVHFPTSKEATTSFSFPIHARRPIQVDFQVRSLSNHSSSAKTIQPTTSKAEHRPVEPMPICRNIPSRASAAETFRVEEWHFVLRPNRNYDFAFANPMDIRIYVCNRIIMIKYTSPSHTQ